MAAASDVERVASLRPKDRPNMTQLANGAIAKSKHSRGDQALLDTAHFAGAVRSVVGIKGGVVSGC